MLACCHIIPAVDVLENEAVRLHRGDFERVVARSGEPAELVRRFASAGARLIHVVDLSGARTGRIRTGWVARLAAAATPARLQASGGIRGLDDARALLDAGAARVVVGTAAFADDSALARFASAFGDRLVVALDARDGKLALAGWERATELRVEDAAQRCAAAGVRRLLCTAIERDGTLAGPDLDLLDRVRAASGLPVLAAGGVRSEADIAALTRAGAEGVIVGRALLEGTVPLSALAAPAEGER